MSERSPQAALPTLARTPVSIDAQAIPPIADQTPLTGDGGQSLPSAGGVSAPMTSDAPPAIVVQPLPLIEAYLDAYSASLGLPPNLVDAFRYSFLSAGKRLRPLLAWHCAVAVGAAPDSCLPAACSVELVHAFSLVHDDLPGIDNDDLRRGRPTLHRQTSEAMAILAGDAMLTLAFQVLVERVDDPALSRDLVRELAAGTSAMIAGQVYDTLGGFPAGMSQGERLTTIHHNKTGALIRAACRMGALSGVAAINSPAAADSLAAISRYADAVGLMFQIVDDLLDVTQTTDHLGKKAGKDLDAGKLTFPGVHGIEVSRRQVRELLAESLAAIRTLGPAAEPLRELASYMAIRTR